MSVEESQPDLLGIKSWVDADACPRAIKEILYRVAKRIPVMVTFVANHVPASNPAFSIDAEKHPVLLSEL